MKDWKFTIPLVLLFAAFVVIQLLMPKPLDWKQSFSSKDKIPFGTEALYLLSEDIFPGKSITPVRQTIYEQLNNWEVPNVDNYIFITNELDLPKEDVNRLLNFVRRGGSVFITARRFSGPLADTLKLKTFSHSFFNPVDTTHTDSIGIEFIDSKTLERTGSYFFKSNIASSYFESYDTAYTKILARNTSEEVVFINTKYGKGNIFLSTNPLLFTNYYVLDSIGSGFIAHALSHLPIRDILWDEYYKPGKGKLDSPLRFILSEPSLKWAYFVALFTLLIFTFFTAKRKQRIIPIIQPEVNNTVEFAETIGKLYQNYGDFKDIANKRILYFFDQIRLKYKLNIDIIDQDFVQKISNKTGIDSKRIDELQKHILYIKTQNQISEKDLMKLNTLLDGFYKLYK
jgi:hypothetical protein